MSFPVKVLGNISPSNTNCNLAHAHPFFEPIRASKGMLCAELRYKKRRSFCVLYKHNLS